MLKNINWYILLLVLVLTFFLYNLSGLYTSYDVTHPSETETMYFSQGIIEEQSFIKWLNTNETFDEFNRPSFWTYKQESELFQNTIAIWTYIYSVFFDLIWIQPVVWFSLINIIWLLFAYLIGVKLFHSNKAALLITIFTVCNSYIILRNNFVYWNTIWFTFFLIWLYFFIKDDAYKNLLIGSLCLYIFLLIRHESVIYIVFLWIYFLIKSFKKFDTKLLVTLLLISGSVVGVYFFTNYQIYWKYINIWYLNHEKSIAKRVTTSESTYATILNTLNTYQPFRPRFIKKLWLKNAVVHANKIINRFILDGEWSLIVLYLLLTWVLLFKWKLHKEQRWFLIFWILLSLYFTFFEAFSYHYWWNREWLSSFYSRYLFFIYFFVSVLIWTLYYKKILWNKIVYILLVSSLLLGLDKTFLRYDDWLIRQIEIKDQYYSMKGVLTENSLYPEDTVIVSWIASKIFYDYETYNPLRFFGYNIDPMFGTRTNWDIDLCGIFDYVTENSPDKKLVIIEYKDHKSSYLGLWWKYQWEFIYQEDAYEIYVVDRARQEKICWA